MADTAPFYRSGTRFYLPELPYFLPAMLHPQSQLICKESEQWIRDELHFALTDDRETALLLEESASLWTCYVLPTADTDRLRLMCKYTEYLSVFDNAMVDPAKIGGDPAAAKELFRRIAGILNDAPDAVDFAWGRALHALWLPMREGFGDAHWDRFLAEVQRFLSGCVSEISSRARNTVFDYESYLRVRRDSVGMGMYFVLGEYGLGIDLTQQLADSAPLRELIDVALEHIMLTNDMFSFRAEAAMNDYVNAIAVLCISEGLTLQAAVDRLFMEIEKRRFAFLRLRAAIEDSELGADPDVRSYLDALWHMMAGNLQWSYLTSRYNGHGHSWNGARSGVVTLFDDRTVFSTEPYHTLRT